MKTYFKVAIALLATLALGACSTTGAGKPPGETAAHYQMEDLYGAWFSNADDGRAQALALLVLKQDGSATDVLIVTTNNSMHKVVQQSSWSYDAERNVFEQRIHEVSEQNGQAPAKVSHPDEVIRATVELSKLGDQVLGIKFRQEDGEVIDYLKGSPAMLEKLKDVQ